MPGYRFEDLLYGGLLAVVALVSLIVALASARRNDGEAVRMSLGFTIMLGLCSLVLCTGWVNILPLPH
jgi:hypothetical protein